MDRLARKLAITLLAAACFAVAFAAPAAARIAFGPCRHSNDLACGRLTVPLDPTGATPGTLSLAIRRHRAALGPARTAVIALAGGPGQPAIPFTEDFMEILGPILQTRDLIVFDQRGTGHSHPLSCHAFESERGEGGEGGEGTTVRRCADQIGPTRRFYTTAESVADIEAIRVAGGYEKLVLYGTSYGTKVAEQYAEEHPGNVEALVLDSVVPVAGPEPLGRATFAAIPRVLRGLCAFHGCAGITRDPVRELRRLVRRIGGGKLQGSALSGRGIPRSIGLSSDNLIGMLLEGDLDPLLRSEFPAAVRSALAGDRAPLSRLITRAEGEEEGGPAEIDLPLYYATSCEEQPFPWSRSASPSRRIAEAASRIDSLPKRSLSPFTARNMLDLSDLRECASWPFQTPQPPAPSGHLPSVPTLILSGRNDLRTPNAEASRVAAAIPGAHLLLVPNAGHDVLGTEQSSCGLDALHAFFAKRPIKRCVSSPPSKFLRPTPVAPRRLSAVRPAKGYSGRAGHTLAALAMTMVDLDRQIALQVLAGDASERGSGGLSLSIGGLRHGWTHLTPTQLTLHRYSYVPGVTISGDIRSERATLRIGGRHAAHGTLRLGPHGRLLGRLGATRVDVAAKGYSAQAARGRSSPGEGPFPAARGAGHPLARSVRELDKTIGLLQPGSGLAAEQTIQYALSHTALPR